VAEELKHDRRQFLGTVTLALFGSVKGLVQPMKLGAVQPAMEGELRSLGGATGWLNSQPLTAPGLRGKVVLIDFCTYTCINWLRTLPYVRAWAGKYKDHGLVVIGAHTPEFAFEKDLDNVRRAVQEMRVDYPIAIDNDYAIWRGFGNNYWPALYLIDAKGAIKHRQFGEGGYEQAEGTIQKLLAEAGAADIGRETVTVTGQGFEAAADWDTLRSLETYLGSDRAERFVSARGVRPASGHLYTVPPTVRLNEWAVAGDWTQEGQPFRLNAPNGRIVTRFHSRDLHLVMGPAVRGTSVRYRVRLDGQVPGSAHGLDIDAQGQGTVTQQRLYQLIRQPAGASTADRQFEVEFLDAGVEAFVFTFG